MFIVGHVSLMSKLTGHGIGYEVPMPIIEGVALVGSFLWLYLFFAPWRDDDGEG